jgi:hypothetical protein
MQFNLYLYSYILCTTKLELHVIKIINVVFDARTDQVRRVLLTTITDDVDIVLVFQPCSFRMDMAACHVLFRCSAEGPPNYCGSDSRFGSLHRL